MSKHCQDLEEKINNATDFLSHLSLGGVVLSGLLLVTPVKAVGYVGIGGSLGAFASAVISKKKHIKAAQNKIEELINCHRSETSVHHELLLSKADEIQILKAEKLKAFSEITSLQSDLKITVDLQEKITAFSQQKQLEKDRIESISQILDDSIKTSKAAVQELIEQFRKSISSMAYSKSEPEDILQRLSDLLAEGEELLTTYESKLQVIPDKWESLGELLNLFYWVGNDLTNIKIKMVRAKRTKELSFYRQKIEEWEEADLVAKEDVAKLIANYEARLAEFCRSTAERYDGLIGAAKSYEAGLSEDDEFFLKVRMQLQEALETIEKLNAEVARLSKPLVWRSAIRADMKAANIIIRYFEALGVILDRSHNDFEPHQATLWFSTDRTGRLILAKELNEHSDKLQALTHSLTVPEFTLDPESGMIKVLVRWANAPKVNSQEHVKRLLTDLEKGIAKVINSLSDKPTIRIMGATGEGKGVMARYLINQILQQNTWYTRLHDPQDGSSEDYWGIPKVSRSGSQLKQALKAIAEQMEEREENGWKVATLDALDEIDTHLDKREKTENFIDLISRIRHLGMKLILIGQNPKVGRAGFEWSDMQQMNCIYMGASAYDAIIANPQLKPKESKLVKEYLQLSEYFEELNEGLDGGEKHLFGLVVIPGKSPFWVELPRPDSIEINGNSNLLGNSFAIPISLIEFIDAKNRAKGTGFSAKTNNNSTSTAAPETLVNQGQPRQPGATDYVGVTALNGSSGSFGSPTCKQHPEAELTTRKDGRHYCPSCKKRLSKSEVEYR